MIITTDVAQMQLAECTIVYDNVTVTRDMKVTVEPADASTQIAMMYKTQVTHRVEFILSVLQDMVHPLMYSVTWISMVGAGRFFNDAPMVPPTFTGTGLLTKTDLATFGKNFGLGMKSSIT